MGQRLYWAHYSIDEPGLGSELAKLSRAEMDGSNAMPFLEQVYPAPMTSPLTASLLAFQSRPRRIWLIFSRSCLTRAGLYRTLWLGKRVFPDWRCEAMTPAAADNACRKQKLTVQRWLGEAQRTGKRQGFGTAQSQQRFSWSTAVVLAASQDGGPTLSIHGNTCDISSKGLGARCRQGVATGTQVEVRITAWGGSVLGVVRNCTRSMGEFRVGVEFLFHGQAHASGHKAA